MIGAIGTAGISSFVPPPKVGTIGGRESTPSGPVHAVQAEGEAGPGVDVGPPSALIDFGGIAALQAGAKPALDEQGLTDEERKTIKKLAARDQEVRRHEEAHARAGGQYAGAPSYTFERGPNGKAYAVAGRVSIDVSPVSGDPQATIDKMEVVKRAALAPAEPSAQDRQLAGRAEAERLKAQAELQTERAAERRVEDEPSLPSPADRPLVGAGFVGASSFNPAFAATHAGASTLFDLVA